MDEKMQKKKLSEDIATNIGMVIFDNYSIGHNFSQLSRSIFECINGLFTFLMSSINASNITNFEKYALHWTVSYSVIGVIFTAFAIIYLILTIQDITPMRKTNFVGYTAQISYIAALFTKGFGSFGCAIFFMIPMFTKNCTHEDWEASLNNWNQYSIIPSGTPGYASAAAYCCIFFSWCTLCIEYLAKDSKKFYNKTQIIVKTCLIFISIMFIISLGSLCFNQKRIQNTIHLIESGFACFRDLVIAICFLIYLVRIYKQFNTTLCSFSTKPESILLLMCIMLIVCLFLRILSILLYFIQFNGASASQKDYTTKDDEFCLKYLGIFIFEQILTEFAPLGVIGMVRFLSWDHSNQSSYEYEAAFTNFD
ncbi:hypothetical protein TRFO_05229 [Tritrichomonas foetus]|uniref:THH1/TOM1/TOM3 domain-containing protein n=1 Tax=Tritrichomonas foetus TaxID=1144522 RepID=A0A1J4K846_9EUKA|nr:hypothetical protein TRFO_05229 [Tritrichomonas foetus]|eukprot:OHT07575.1 hypothetical protein TRFO_05229 [Tritrichomonas foetus]